MRLWKQQGTIHINDNFVDCASLIRTISNKRMPRLAQELLIEMRSEGLLPCTSTLSALMLCYAENGLFPQAHAVFEELLNSSFEFNIQLVSDLVDAYARMGLFSEILEMLDRLALRNVGILSEAYLYVISCFGRLGELELMEIAVKEMVSKGFSVDSVTWNRFIKYYSRFGSLTDMECAYARLKRSRHLIDKEGIRAMSLAYLKEKKFYRLGVFLKDVGLRRKDVGNLLWNLLLLSYAANFKMKSLQREFLNMFESGFCPDVTTFNIRALAFSRMSLFWDLHLSLEHMRHECVVPDLVTYGCVVDAYLDRRLARNLDFVFNKMQLDDSPVVATDPFVFEVLGKGDFQLFSEAFLEFKRPKGLTYKELIRVYIKKQFRRNQIFWNY